MNYDNSTHKQYLEALKRVVKNDVKPSKASVAREAGKDPASIKPGRSDWMDQIIEDINKAYDTWIKKNKNSESRQNKRLKDKDEKIAELEQRLNSSHANELYLIKKVHDLEREIASLRSSKPSLAEISANLTDYSKL